VAAPSKLQKPAGDRVKTDARDAVHLARLLRLDEVTPVAITSKQCANMRRKKAGKSGAKEAALANSGLT
jgi:transposase